MEQEERRRSLIRALLDESPRYRGLSIPEDEQEQRHLLRSLMNVRPAGPISPEVERLQDEYLQEENKRRGCVDLSALRPMQPGLYLWRGDITTLRCGAIVNAANSGMTGCYRPLHGCIDNCIHTYAGVQLRLACAELMAEQGHEEPTGTAKLTPAFDLPCDYVLHTVGPIIYDRVTRREEKQLASCYRSCLELAEKNDIKSVAFCCISTGEFRFPNQRAAEIAVETVRAYQTHSKIEVIFNVFKETDEVIYRKLLAC
jgi:O-acetyl-ADP-ribose deacetylase (regulator of RNase III)